MFLGRMIDSIMPGSNGSFFDLVKGESIRKSLKSIRTHDSPMSKTSHMILKRYFCNEKNLFIEKYNSKQIDNATLKDFVLQRRLGQGSFRTVASANHRRKSVAMKILEKHHIVKLKQIRHVINECHLLGAIHCPFIV
ncbi:hypothetical protein I4U23_006939 [Adineta vaga]|nr:hypothetical protein I4U23_006939 [Adineta vaga]